MLCARVTYDIRLYKMVSNQQTAQERNTKSTSLHAGIDIHLPNNY
jgi:beta-glucosidase-like glycosyl hydrolase